MNFEASCQTTQNPEDSVCLTAEDARVIFKDLQLFQLCDSIRENQAMQIVHFKNAYKADQQQILLHMNRLSEMDKKLLKTQKKLQISRKLSTFGMPIAFGAGILTTFLILK
jgi:hypothetical protein